MPKKLSTLVSYIHVAYLLATRGKWDSLDMYLKTSYDLVNVKPQPATIDIIVGPVQSKHIKEEIKHGNCNYC